MTTDTVRILPYEPRHAADWARLTAGWLIEGGFAIEPKDQRIIDDPQGMILNPGGRIVVAERDGEVLGCCALLAMDDGGFEVSKMCVAPAARGLGLGRALLQAVEDLARSAGAPRLYLETARTLAPALGLYRSFGFEHLPPRPSPYARSDVWMEKRL